MPSGLTAETELLLKHLAPKAGGSILIALPPSPSDAIALVRHMSADETLIHTPDSGLHAAISGAARNIGKRFGLRVVLNSWCSPQEAGFCAGILYLPREREMAEAALAMTHRTLKPSAPAWLVGSLRAGARTAPALSRRFLGHPLAIASGRHGRLYRARVDASLSVPAGLDHWSRSFPMRFSGREITVVSLPGVFSHGRLDQGTELLLKSVPPREPAPRSVLDFGCGSGVIGTCLKILWPSAKIDLIDVNAVSIEAARRTLAANGLDPAAARISDGFAGVTEKYDLIISNPPFHSGTATDRSVAESLIRGAADHLLPGGTLRLVANRFLPYPSILKSVFGRVASPAENGRYRVLESSRRRGEPR